jgi:hypothetical protein
MSDDKELREQEVMALEVARRAAGVAVVDVETMREANGFTVALREREKAIDGFFDPLIAAAHKAHKALTTKRNEIKSPVANARRDLESKIAQFISREEERRRIEAEIARKTAQDEAEVARLATAEQLEREGLGDLAEEVLAGTDDVPAVSVGPPPIREELSGITTFEHWFAEVIDFRALVRAVALGEAPEVYVVPDLSALNRAVKTFKGEFSCPGVSVRREMRVRGK